MQIAKKTAIPDESKAEDMFFFNSVTADLEDFYIDGIKNHVKISTQYNKDE